MVYRPGETFPTDPSWRDHWTIHAKVPPGSDPKTATDAMVAEILDFAKKEGREKEVSIRVAKRAPGYATVTCKDEAFAKLIAALPTVNSMYQTPPATPASSKKPPSPRP